MPPVLAGRIATESARTPVPIRHESSDSIHTAITPKPGQISRSLRQILAWSLSVIGCVTFLAGLTFAVLIFHRVQPPVAVNSPAAIAAELRAELQGPSRSINKGPTILRVNEANLNSLIEQQLARYRESAKQTSGAKLPDVKVKLIEDRMVVYLTFDVHGAQTTLAIEGTLRSQNGYMRFEPMSVQVGAITIPAAILAEGFRKFVASPKYQEFMRLPGNISEMYLAKSELVSIYK
jgi:hypothetical protein